MTRVQLLADVQTGGRYAPRGSVIEVADELAARWVALGIAEPAPEPPPRAHRPPEALAIAQRRAFSC